MGFSRPEYWSGVPLPSLLLFEAMVFQRLVEVLLFSKSCLTLCDPMDCSPPGSSVHGISKARILEWVTISFSRAFSQPRDQTYISCISDDLLHCRQSACCILNTVLKSLHIYIQLPQQSFEADTNNKFFRDEQRPGNVAYPTQVQTKRK